MCFAFQDVHLVRADVLCLLHRRAHGQVHQARERRLQAGVLLQRVRQEGLVQGQELVRQPRQEDPLQRRRQQGTVTTI